MELRTINIFFGLLILSMMLFSCETEEIILSDKKVEITIHSEKAGDWVQISEPNDMARFISDGRDNLARRIHTTTLSGLHWYTTLDGNKVTIESNNPLEVTYQGDITFRYLE